MLHACCKKLVGCLKHEMFGFASSHLHCAEGSASPCYVTRTGSIALWAGFAMLMLIGFVTKCFLRCRKQKQRSFYRLASTVCFIAAAAHLLMAVTTTVYTTATSAAESYFGVVLLASGRVLFSARYAEWFLTTPLQTLGFARLSGASTETTVWLLGCVLLMVTSGLTGALVAPDSAFGNIRYAFWGIGMFFFGIVVYWMLSGAVPRNMDRKALRIFRKYSRLTVIAWAAYPLIWIAAEGSESISPDLETLLYTISNVMSKFIFCLYVVSAPHMIDARGIPDGGVPLVGSSSPASIV